MPTVLDAIATGTPSLRKSQSDAADFMTQIERLPDPLRNRLPAIYRGSAIDARHSCVADYGKDDPDDFTFFPPNWSLDPAPSTRDRNEQYREAAIPLAEDVGRRAMEDAQALPKDITHVIAVSCTGFFAPGLDVELVKRLGLPPTTQRTVVGFMGCYAAFNALRVAHSFCQSQPDARVLIVCVELCTLHFQIDDTLESVIVNSLFADGAAAAVLSRRAPADARGRYAYVDGRCQMDDDSMEAMTWAIGDTGFEMGLSSRVPDVIAEHLPGYVDALLAPHDLAKPDIDFWAIHPGGRRIVEAAADALNLPEGATRDSLAVLRQYGNMSSPTVLFVLQRILDRAAAANGQAPAHGVAMAFGPGLTLEGALFQRV